MRTIRFHHRAVSLVAALVATCGGVAAVAQIESGDRGVPPIASAGDYAIGNIKVDVTGKTPEEARQNGWKLAERKAWDVLWRRTGHGSPAPDLPDSRIESLVSAVEIDHEDVGPKRYVATLIVHFDRARSGGLLGTTSRTMRSPPLLVIPEMISAGTRQVFESATEWQKAWARFRTGDSAIDYVRTSGAGPDPLLLNAGQAGRRGRIWWRALLDEYGAADVIMPIASIHRLYPGGPVQGTFSARYGPDSQLIGTFTMTAPNADGLPAMMDAAVRKMDELYTQAFDAGILRPDPSLIIEEPVEPEDLGIEEGQESAVDVATLLTPDEAAGLSTIAVQFDTPDAASIGATEGLVRSLPGVRSASTTSLALGGTSVMQVRYQGAIDTLRDALAARGYDVQAGSGVLRIRRRGAAEAPAQP